MAASDGALDDVSRRIRTMRCVGISVEEARQVCASHVLLPVVQTILFVCGVAVAFVIAQGTARAQDNPASLFGTEKKPQLIAEVPLDLRGSHPVIRAEFLGEERRFVIDTGASITFVDESFRGQLGSSSNEDVADSSSGDVHVKVFGKRTIFIGAKPFSGLIGIGPPDFDFDSLGSQLAGTIGMDCFKDFVLELNPSDKVMRVYDHAPNSLAKEGESFPVRNSINCIMARGTLPDVGSEEFLIDSGGQSSMLLRARSLTGSQKPTKFVNFIPPKCPQLLELRQLRLGNSRNSRLERISFDLLM